MAEQTAVKARRDGASARGYAVPEVTVRLAGALLAVAAVHVSDQGGVTALAVAGSPATAEKGRALTFAGAGSMASRGSRTYLEFMAAVTEPVGGRVASAAARTVAAGSARLFAAWCTGSPLPDAADRRCEGVADLAARRARVSQSLLFTDRVTASLMELSDGDPALREPVEHSEMLYDGANAYVRVAGRWTGFSLVDPGGPRGPADPLWPLDALFGAGDDAVEIGPEAVRGVPVTRCRLTVNLARADAALPAGVSVPSGPYRSLSRLPAQVWLDAAGLARRISVNAEPDAPADLLVWSIAELWDFGVTAGIRPPGPDEILAPAEAYRLADGEPPGRTA